MSTSPFPCTQSIKRIERSEMQVVLLHSFQNVLKAVLGYRKARRVTSTSSGLKRLKTQNTMSEKRKGDTLKGIPKSIHKRELILDEEEFDASSSGGDDGNRTRVRKEVHASISGCSSPTGFPHRQAGKRAAASVASSVHGSKQSLMLLTCTAK